MKHEPVSLIAAGTDASSNGPSTSSYELLFLGAMGMAFAGGVYMRRSMKHALLPPPDGTPDERTRLPDARVPDI